MRENGGEVERRGRRSILQNSYTVTTVNTSNRSTASAVYRPLLFSDSIAECGPIYQLSIFP